MLTQRAITVKVRMEYGDPNEFRTAELPSSNFHAVAFPRKHIDQLKRKVLETLEGAGVYILIGPSMTRGKREVYIGESSRKVINRIRNHNNPKNTEYKEFWESVVIITTNNNEIISRTKFIEGELIRYEGINRNWNIVNNNSSSYESKSLSASDEDFVLEFIDASKIMLACLGYNLLQKSVKSTKPTSKILSRSVSEARSRRKRTAKFICRGLGGVYAEMTIDPNGGFVVSKDSIARGRLAASLAPRKKSDRQNLIHSGILRKRGDNFVFTKDYKFKNVSSAAIQVMGCHRSGSEAWKLEGKGTTYGEWKKANNIK